MAFVFLMTFTTEILKQTALAARMSQSKIFDVPHEK
jgi:hypothetical protein